MTNTWMIFISHHILFWNILVMYIFNSIFSKFFSHFFFHYYHFTLCNEDQNEDVIWPNFLMNVKARITLYFTTMCFTYYVIQVSLRHQLCKPSIYVGHVTHKLLKLVHIFVGLFKGNLLFTTSHTWMNQTKMKLKSLLLISRFIAQMSLG